MKKKAKHNKNSKPFPKQNNIDGLEDLSHQELSGPSEKLQSTDYTNTDENENEGLGDGNMGKSTADFFQK